jgi:hypothetical protein
VVDVVEYEQNVLCLPSALGVVRNHLGDDSRAWELLDDARADRCGPATVLTESQERRQPERWRVLSHDRD